MKKTLSLILATAFYIANVGLHAQEASKTAVRYMDKLDSNSIKKNLTILASDEYGGRGTGQKGGAMAQEYIANYLKTVNVDPAQKGNYFQDTKTINRKPGDKKMAFEGFDFKDHFTYNNTNLQDSIIQADSILFLAHGIYSPSINDYAKHNIENKILLLISGPSYNKYGVQLSNNDKSQEYWAKHKPKAILKASLGFDTRSSYAYEDIIYDKSTNSYSYSGSSSYETPEIIINELIANKLLESTGKTLKQITYEIERDGGSSPTMEIPRNIIIKGLYQYQDAKVYNVIGMIEGTDLKDEYIIVSAHHDHDGIKYDRIYNGADDNASGVASVMEIARVMAEAKKAGKASRRSIIFLFTAAEEKGMRGAFYYVNNPIFPLDKTRANLNLDMLGRKATEYQAKDNNYTYIISHETQSGDLVSRAKSINDKSLAMQIDLKHTAPNDNEDYFRRSDQYSFAQKNIPAIALTSGIHPDYHETTDDSDLIDYDGLLKRTKLAFLLLWDMANTDSKFPKAEEKREVEELKSSVSSNSTGIEIQETLN